MPNKTVHPMLCAAILAGSLCVAFFPGANVEKVPAAAVTSMRLQEKRGLVKESGVCRYYEDGKLVKSCWRKLDGGTYYFKKNGNAAVGSCKIKGSYYIFDAQGKLIQPSAVTVIDIQIGGASVKYRVNPDGTAAAGWDKNKTHYFFETGEMAKGVQVLEEQFYGFKPNGAYDEARTKKLRKAAKYEKPFAALKKMIGEPKNAVYYPSGDKQGKEGILAYGDYEVYTFQPEQGAELYMGAEYK